MAYAYPIWHQVTACNYRSSKSYGSKETAETMVSVGGSAKNSHQFVGHCTTRRPHKDNDLAAAGWIVFRFFVDLDPAGSREYECLKRAFYNTKSKEYTETDPATQEAAA